MGLPPEARTVYRSTPPGLETDVRANATRFASGDQLGSPSLQSSGERLNRRTFLPAVSTITIPLPSPYASRIGAEPLQRACDAESARAPTPLATATAAAVPRRAIPRDPRTSGRLHHRCILSTKTSSGDRCADGDLRALEPDVEHPRDATKQRDCARRCRSLRAPLISVMPAARASATSSAASADPMPRRWYASATANAISAVSPSRTSRAIATGCSSPST